MHEARFFYDLAQSFAVEVLGVRTSNSITCCAIGSARLLVFHCLTTPKERFFLACRRKRKSDFPSVSHVAHARQSGYGSVDSWRHKFALGCLVADLTIRLADLGLDPKKASFALIASRRFDLPYEFNTAGQSWGGHDEHRRYRFVSAVFGGCPGYAAGKARARLTRCRKHSRQPRPRVPTAQSTGAGETVSQPGEPSRL